MRAQMTPLNRLPQGRGEADDQAMGEWRSPQLPPGAEARRAGNSGRGPGASPPAPGEQTDGATDTTTDGQDLSPPEPRKWAPGKAL